MRRKKLIILLVSFTLILIISERFFSEKGADETNNQIGKRITATLDDRVENYWKYTGTITELNDSFIKESNGLQTHLSHLLFWEKDNERQSHAAAASKSQIFERNYALLDYFTKGRAVSPEWKSFLEFSLSSTAFIQNYYFEAFHPSTKSISPTDSNIEKYEKLLFPWLKSSIKTLFYSFKGKGIVITTGNRHFQFAFLLVKSLRIVLNSRLPIEIIYADEEDLAKEKCDLISQFKDVTCINLSKNILRSELSGVNSWWWKAFSILMSSFSEVIFIDADVLFLQPPEILFSHPHYEKYGAVFFRDRKLIWQDTFLMMMKEYPFPSETLQQSGLWNKKTNHQVESGVLLYNKSNHASFFALLNTCNLNRKPMQDKILKYFHGDKETFWNGFELSLLPYALVDGYSGALGYQESRNNVCGNIAHSDERGNLLWFNGGLAINKEKLVDQILEFTHYSIDPEVLGSSWWFWSQKAQCFCWSSQIPGDQIRKLTNRANDIIKRYVEIYREIRNGTLNIGI